MPEQLEPGEQRVKQVLQLQELAELLLEQRAQLEFQVQLVLQPQGLAVQLVQQAQQVQQVQGLARLGLQVLLQWQRLLRLWQARLQRRLSHLPEP